MQLGNFVIEDRIQKEFKVFSGVIDEAGLEETSQVESETIETKKSEEQSALEEVAEEKQTESQLTCEEKSIWKFWENNDDIPACTLASKLDEEPENQKGWWEFWKSDTPENLNSQSSGNDSWWKFWKDNDDDPGIFSTLDSFWGLTLNVWDHVAQATKIVGTLVLNTGTIIDASLTLLALYLIKLILIPALFLYFSIKLLRGLMSRENKFLDYSMEKMNPFRQKEGSKD